jgi:hypothetical protein
MTYERLRHCVTSTNCDVRTAPDPSTVQTLDRRGDAHIGPPIAIRKWVDRTNVSLSLTSTWSSDDPRCGASGGIVDPSAPYHVLNTPMVTLWRGSFQEALSCSPDKQLTPCMSTWPEPRLSCPHISALSNHNSLRAIAPKHVRHSCLAASRCKCHSIHHRRWWQQWRNLFFGRTAADSVSHAQGTRD